MNFVRADWSEVESWFVKFQPREGELAITCGRVNHLWNNMFSSIRNDYISERYPEDMPGTILEVNSAWAATQGLQNGSVVDVVDAAEGPKISATFAAVVSLQDALPEGTAFAIFSYPVWDKKTKAFSFDGYANNVMNGYFDGINAIGALKYARGKIVPRQVPVFESKNRRGPVYAARNNIVAQPLSRHLRPGIDAQGRWSYSRRLDWCMRELIVVRGLPRAFVHSGERRQDSLLDPDEAFEYVQRSLRGVFTMMVGAMQWPQPGRLDAGRLDHWDDVDVRLAQEWAKSIDPDERIDGAPLPSLDPDEADLRRFFLAWSQHLTGFGDLAEDVEHAASLLARLRRAHPELGGALVRLVPEAVYGEDGSLRVQFLKRLGRDDLKTLRETVTILWYTGAFHNRYGFPRERSTANPEGGFGSMHEDHYRKGLLWRATGLQPTGYSTKMVSWGVKPESTGEEDQ